MEHEDRKIDEGVKNQKIPVGEGRRNGARPLSLLIIKRRTIYVMRRIRGSKIAFKPFSLFYVQLPWYTHVHVFSDRKIFRLGPQELHECLDLRVQWLKHIHDDLISAG